MSRLGLLRRAQQLAAARVLRDNRGVSAVEFALVAPLMLALYFGAVEITQRLEVQRKVTLTARSLSDLVAQSVSISNADMTNIFTAAKSIMTPLPEGPLTARVSAVNVNASGEATIGWSSTYGDIAARATGSSATIPPGLRLPNTQLIWSEISYDYTSPASYFVVGTVEETDQFFARPRQSSTVCRPPAVTTCS
ncbi:pilus assembly protein [Bradyrhizobium sp. LHD-71]|uniref:TadE/TadG family type IV pilus assembly protein n=1 Tax=Bradyrhizobium sp. LHD-71 TaxID=3072141 RepID=UPI00280E2AFB|nr:pilus assembly protein [Bradyrhizobium sp. LHD-71]MDQ8727018.1 pilus assembly protein [Bradyrhizobium sp. LHD-71]